MLTRISHALIDLSITELSSVTDHTLTDRFTVDIDASTVMTIRCSASVDLLLASVSVVTCATLKLGHWVNDFRSSRVVTLQVSVSDPVFDPK